MELSQFAGALNIPVRTVCRIVPYDEHAFTFSDPSLTHTYCSDHVRRHKAFQRTRFAIASDLVSVCLRDLASPSSAICPSPLVLLR